MEQTASELAVLLEGQVVGNPETRVRKLAKIESAGPGSVSFLSNPEYERFLYNTAASVVIVAEDFQPSRALPTTLTLLRVADPYRAFARLLEAYDEILKRQEGIHPSAIVDADASIGEGCFIGPGVVIERGAVIGDRVELHAPISHWSRRSRGPRHHLAKWRSGVGPMPHWSAMQPPGWRSHWCGRFWICTTRRRQLCESASDGQRRDRGQL